jgi:hypothetical protein
MEDSVVGGKVSGRSKLDVQRCRGKDDMERRLPETREHVDADVKVRGTNTWVDECPRSGEV